MKRSLPALAAVLLLASCGMSPAERDEYLERSVTVRSAHLSLRGDSGLLPWVQAEARGDLELLALRIRLYEDRNGDGQPQDAEYTGIARVREANVDGEVLLRISTLTFKSGLLRPILLCEVDTSEGPFEQILVLE